jgi:hypothetical protein
MPLRGIRQPLRELDVSQIELFALPVLLHPVGKAESIVRLEALIPSSTLPRLGIFQHPTNRIRQSSFRCRSLRYCFVIGIGGFVTLTNTQNAAYVVTEWPWRSQRKLAPPKIEYWSK